jgi:hypothetical protein
MVAMRVATIIGVLLLDGSTACQLSGSVTPDGQHLDGTVSCAGASLPIASDRH